MADKKSLVAIAKEGDIQASVTKVFDLLGGVTNMIKKGETVVLKPNAGHAAPPESAVCTNPETLRAVIREVKKAQPYRIVVAESAAIGCDTMECFEVSGMAKVAEEGVELYDLSLIHIFNAFCHFGIHHIIDFLFDIGKAFAEIPVGVRACLLYTSRCV